MLYARATLCADLCRMRASDHRVDPEMEARRALEYEEVKADLQQSLELVAALKLVTRCRAAPACTAC
jgi:hypothetical protein